MNDMIMSNSTLAAAIHDLNKTLDHSKGTKNGSWMHHYAEESHFEIIEYLRDSKNKYECVYWVCLFLLLIGATVFQMVLVIIKYEGNWNKFPELCITVNR